MKRRLRHQCFSIQQLFAKEIEFHENPPARGLDIIRSIPNKNGFGSTAVTINKSENEFDTLERYINDQESCFTQNKSSSTETLSILLISIFPKL